MAPDQPVCSACGAGCLPGARSCPACGADLATVRCARCYHANLAEADACEGCGGELGLEPIAEADTLRCTDCIAVFALYRGSSGALHDCPSCGGQFVEHALLDDLLQRREIYGSAAPRPERAAPSSSGGPVRYVGCPVCRKPMNRKNFGGTSGVIVDICREHGMWFDRGELPRVLAFVASGGLVRARMREIEELEQRRRAAVVEVVRAESAASARGRSEELLGLFRHLRF